MLKSAEEFYDNEFRQSNQQLPEEECNDNSDGSGADIPENPQDANGGMDDDDDELDPHVSAVSMGYDISMGMLSPHDTRSCCRCRHCNYLCGCSRQRLGCGQRRGRKRRFPFCCFSSSADENEEQSQDNGADLVEKPSNEELLSVAFLSFLTFTLCQAIAAYIAKSEAMLADSMAMCVDAFTYGFNLIAERMKNKNENSGDYDYEYDNHNGHDYDDNRNEDFNYDDDDNDIDDDEGSQQHRLQQRDYQRKKRQRDKRKLKLLLELVPPLVSVVTLVTVTIYILHESITSLVSDFYEGFEERQGRLDNNDNGDDNENDDDGQGQNPEGEGGWNKNDEPNITVMLVFSSINLMVDLGNVLFFAKADHAFGYDTLEEDVHDVVQYDHDDQVMDLNDRSEDCEDDRRDGDSASTSTPTMMMTTTPSKVNGTNAKENYKRILRERRTQRGGAYSHITMLGDDDDDEEEDGNGHGDVNENDNRDRHKEKEERLEFELTPWQIQEGPHDPTMFSIGDDDNDDENGMEEGKESDNCRRYGDGVNNQSGSMMMDDDEAEQYIANYEQRKGKANLNMCSAYTHVFADTIRSIAVLTAAILGECVHSITPEVADASASIVVSAVILFALLPLLVGMGRSYMELMAIRREEASERDMEMNLSYGHSAGGVSGGGTVEEDEGTMLHGALT